MALPPPALISASRGCRAGSISLPTRCSMWRLAARVARRGLSTTPTKDIAASLADAEWWRAFYERKAARQGDRPFDWVGTSPTTPPTLRLYGLQRRRKPSPPRAAIHAHPDPSSTSTTREPSPLSPSTAIDPRLPRCGSSTSVAALAHGASGSTNSPREPSRTWTPRSWRWLRSGSGLQIRRGSCLETRGACPLRGARASVSVYL